MQARCCKGITSSKQICIMFGILVKPVLTYGCEVDALKKYRRLHIR